MRASTIKKLQDTHGLKQMQDMINSGQAWKMEGSYGRAAMSHLESGACMLPKERHRDYYGNTVPSRDDLKAGTKGTFQNSVNFWTAVQNGDIEMEVEDGDDF
jgi:hypothetical protein